MHTADITFPDLKIGALCLLGYGFDNAWEIVPGVWTEEIWYQDRMLAERTFTVSKTERGDRFRRLRHHWANNLSAASRVPPQSANSDRPSAEKYANASRAEFGFLGLIVSTVAWADAKLLGDLPHALSAAWLVQVRMRGPTITRFVTGMCWISLKPLCFLPTPHEIQRPKTCERFKSARRLKTGSQPIGGRDSIVTTADERRLKHVRARLVSDRLCAALARGGGDPRNGETTNEADYGDIVGRSTAHTQRKRVSAVRVHLRHSPMGN